MFPINNRCLKQQEDSRTKIIKESQLRLPQMTIPEFCSHLHNPMENYMESYLKNQLDIHQSHNLVGVQHEECFYDNLKNNWYFNNNNCYEDFYSYNKIKREEYDQQKLWPPQIKDQQSQSINHDQGFQACQIPKQQELEYMPRYSFQDPNKFLGSCLTASREEKNNQRKLKVEAYLKKKSMRSFQKKIIYKCRKQVADNRIRYRGRFISFNQAAQILGLDQKVNYNSVELMQKLKSLNQVDNLIKQNKSIKQNHNNKEPTGEKVCPDEHIVKKIEEQDK